MKGPYCIEVETDPVPQPRPRATVVSGKARVYNPPTTKAYKQEIIRMFVRVPDHFPEGIPVRVTIEYFFQLPKTLQRKKDPAGLILHTRKPDLDNLNKAVLDALSDSGIWNDDQAGL